jgi:glycosyltransferase involved in cell wall biosynthesis
MQEADFDFEIVVGDDCSTDSTPDILVDYSEQYPGKFVLLLNETNEGVSRNNINVLSHCSGKYVAMCEGDDYWLEKKKLSRQVEFLENNTDYGFVGSPCLELLPTGEMRVKAGEGETGRWILVGDVFESTMSGPIVRTPSLCFRNSIIKPYLSYVGAGNDTVLQAILAKHSLYARWSLPMAVYRIGGISNAHSSLEKELKYNDYVYANRHLKNLLFPDHFHIDEDALLDRGDYIRLKYAIREKKWRKALEIKKRLRTLEYRKKKYAKYLNGPISCLFLSFVLNR